MIIFDRYLHVWGLVIHYAGALNVEDVRSLMGSRVETSGQAFLLSNFIWDLPFNVEFSVS